MSGDISIEQDLAQLADLAARLLAVPVVSLTLYQPGSCAADNPTIAHSAVRCDDRWKQNFPDYDLAQLSRPQGAVGQKLGLYASVPVRDAQGKTTGMVACADDRHHELSAAEIDILKQIAGLSSAIMRSRH